MNIEHKKVASAREVLLDVARHHILEMTGGGIKLTKCGTCGAMYHEKRGHACPGPAPKE